MKARLMRLALWFCVRLRIEIISDRTFWAVLQAAGPHMDSVRCLECGLLRSKDTSPEISNHAFDCTGMERWEAVAKILNSRRGVNV